MTASGIGSEAEFCTPAVADATMDAGKSPDSGKSDAEIIFIQKYSSLSQIHRRPRLLSERLGCWLTGAARPYAHVFPDIIQPVFDSSAVCAFLSGRKTFDHLPGSLPGFFSGNCCVPCR